MTGKGPEEPEMTVTEETSRMTMALTFLVIAQEIDTTLGAWPMGTGCLPTKQGCNKWDNEQHWIQ